MKRSRKPGFRSAAGAVSLALGTLALTAGAKSVGDGTADVEGARVSLEKYVETRRIISREKQEWQLGREVLQDRIDIVRRELETLRGRIADARKGITDTDVKLAELREENQRHKDASGRLAAIVAGLEGRTKALLTQVPAPVRDRTRPIAQRFPDSPGETNASLGERFLNVIGVLNEINRFNREISVTSEVRELANGSAAEVTAVYVGLGQAFYVNGDGTAAGTGTSSANGWIWNPAGAAAATSIRELIAVLKSETEPAFVPVPVTVR